eukprot:PhM_4_TR14236/c1_g1_i1/m.12456
MSDRQSQSASVRSGASMSSQGGSSGGRHRTIQVLTQKLPLFPFLVAMEDDHSIRNTLAGFVIEGLQVLAFAVNPHMRYGETIGALSNIVYFWQLPFWDDDFTKLSFTEFSAFMFFSFAVVAILYALMISVLVLWKPQNGDLSLFSYLRRPFGLFTGLLYVPIMHYFLSYAACYDDKLWAFPTETCWSSTHTPYAAISIIGFVLLSLLVGLRANLMYHVTPTEGSPSACAHSQARVAHYLWLTLTAIVYHAVMARNKPEWMCIWVFCTAIPMALLYSMTLPYYQIQSNVIRTFTYLLAAFCAVLSYICTDTSKDAAFRTMDIDGFVILGCAMPIYWFSMTLTSLRLNYEIDASVRSLRDTEVNQHVATLLFPAHLPNCDLVYTLHKEVCADVAEQATEAGEEEREGTASMLVPYIRGVFLPNDVEVATRFLHVYDNILHLVPTVKMLLFATRIYTKGLARFIEHGQITLNLAVMLNSFANKPRTGLQLVDRLSRSESDVALLYQVHKLTVRLKHVLGLRDTSFQKICDLARKLHKEALSHMTQFWTKLQSDQVELSQLASIAAMITAKREESFVQYRRGVNFTQEKNFLLKYASFMDTVMMEPDKGERIRDIVRQEIEEKRKNVMRGSRVQMAGNDVEAEEKLREIGDETGSDISESSTQLSILTYSIMFVLLLFIVAFVVVDIFFFMNHSRVVDTVSAAGQARMLGQHGSTILEQLQQANITSERQEALQTELRSVVRDFQVSFNQITYGKYKTTYESQAKFFKRRGLLYDVGGETVPVGMWYIGYDLIERMDRVNGVFSNLTKNNSVVSHDHEAYIHTAFNDTFGFYHDELHSYQTQAIIIHIVLYVVVLGLFAVLVGLILYYFSKVTAEKLLTLNLFTLVPPRYIDRLLQQSRERVTQFDKEVEADAIEINDATEGADVAKDGMVDADDANDEADDVPRAAPTDPTQEDVISGSSDVAFSHRNSFATLGVLLCLTGVMLAISGVNYFDAPTGSDVNHYRWRLERNIQGVLRNRHAAHSAALAYVTLGDSASLQLYQTCIDEDRESVYHEDRIGPDEELVQAYKVLRDDYDRVVHIEQIALRLVQSHFMGSMSGFDDILGITWDYPSAYTVNLQLPDLSLLGEYAPTNTSYDLSRNATEQWNMARHLLSSELYRTLNLHFRTSASELLFKYAQVHPNSDEVSSSFTVIALIFAALTLVAVVFYGVMRRKSLVSLVSAIAVACIAVVCIIIMALALREVRDIPDLMDNRSSIVEAYNRTMFTATRPAELSQSYVQFADEQYYYEYWIRSVTTDARLALSNFLQSGTAQAELATETLDALTYQNTIAMVLTAAVHGYNSTTQATQHIASVRWDFRSEADFENVRTQIPETLVRGYTTKDYDLLNRTSSEQTNIALFTVLGPRYHMLEDRLSRVVEGAYWSQHIENEQKLDDAIDKFKSYSLIAFILSIVCIAMVLVCVVAMFGDFLKAAATSGKGLTASQATQVQASPAALLAIGFLALGITGLFAYGLVRIEDTRNTAKLLNYASTREWLTAKSMQDVEIFVENTAAGAPIRHSRQQLEETRRLMLENLRYLQFGDEDVGFYMGTAIGSSTQDDIQYGFNRTVSVLGCNPRTVKYEYGVNIQFLAWIRRLGMVASSPVLSVQQRLRDELQNDYHAMIVGLQESTEQYKSDEKSRNGFGFYIVAVICALIVIVVAAFALRSQIKKYVEEEEGTALMIRMIPSEVKENVPIISEFLAPVVSSVNRRAALDEAAAQMSMMPIVAIDHRGTVLKFNEAAESMLQYTAAEVVGNNIKMLMPEKFSNMHDDALSRYKATGIKRITGKEVEVSARLKDGQELPVSLLVREKVRDNNENIFVGFFKDLTKTKELESADRLNNSLQDLAPVPMIAIDTLGSVMKFNRAAEECFGYSSVDVVGQNIKMLMPEEIAKHHDAYLANYLRTRVKTIIDDSRRVTGLKKSGEEFLMDIFVKEIRTNDFGSSSTYLGFVKDLAQDIILEEANIVNDIIANLSPIPIVGIDNTGRIIKFSEAASKVFGYDHTEAMDQNIKLLMPEEIARNHDGYLEAYAETGKKTVVDSERDLEAIHKDGHRFPIRSLIREVKKAGLPPTFVGYLIDCTEEKRMQKNKAIDELIAEMSPIPLCTIDGIGTIQIINRALLLEFGFRRDDLIGQNVKVLMPDDVAVRHDSILARYEETRKRSIIGAARRIVARRRNGTFFPVEIRVEEVRDQDDKATFVGFLRNLTEEIGLEQQFAINDIMMTLSPVPIIAINHTGKIIAFSKAASETFGWTEQEALAANVESLMPEKFAVRHKDFLRAYYETGIKHVVDTTRIAEAIRKNGETFPIEISVREVKKTGQHSMFIAYVKDKTSETVNQQIVQLNAAMVSLCPLPLIQIDVVGTVLQFNDAASHEFGYKTEEVIGRNVKMLMPEEIAKNHDNYLSTYKKTRVRNVIGAPRRLKARRKNGVQFSVDLIIEEITIEGGDSQFIAYIRNVTEELRIMKSNEVNEVIADLFPTALIAITMKGRIIKFNRAASDTFLYSPEEAIGKNVKMLMPEEYAYNHDAYLSAYAKTGVKHVVDQLRTATGRRKDGTVFPSELSVREIKKHGKDSIFIGYVRDSTKDAAMLEAMKIAESVQSLSTIPLITIDTIGTIIHVNEAACRIFEYSEQELIGQNVRMIQPEEVAKNHDKYLSNYLKTKVKRVIGTRKEQLGRKKSGARFPIELSVRELRLVDDTPAYISSIRDLSNEYELQRHQAINDAIFNNSIAPVVVVDTSGTVRACSASVERELGWTKDDLKGNNIKIIMQDDIAKDHDEFLATYAKTGVKKMIGTKNTVAAKLKSGELATLELFVREVTTELGDKLFIGYLRDRRPEFMASLNKTLSQVLVDKSRVPIISITEKGIVTTFNGAAEQALQYSASEVIGKNVKMLMPFEHAIKHDQYLDNYRKTRVKHVIDNKQLLLARRRDGSNYQVELVVSEITNEVDGRTFYVAYMRAIEPDLLLKQAEALHNTLMELSTIPIVATDAAGIVLQYTSRAEEVFGYTRDEVIGKDVKILMPESIARQHKELMERYLKTGIKRVVDTTRRIPAVHKDGTNIQIEINLREIPQPHDKPVYYSFLADVRTEIDRQNLVLMSEACMSIMEPIICMRFDGIVTHISNAALKMWGYDASEVIDKNVKMLMPDAIAKDHDDILHRYLQTKEKRVVDQVRNVTAKHKMGFEFPIELRVKECVVDGGKESTFVGLVRDSSVDLKLAVQKDMWTTLADCSRLAMVSINQEGIIMGFNRAAEQLFNFQREHVIGRNVKILMPEGVGKRHDAYIKDYLNTGVAKAVGSTRIIEAETKSGTVFKAELTVREVVHADGKKTFVAAIRDASKALRAAANLARRVR